MKDEEIFIDGPVAFLHGSSSAVYFSQSSSTAGTSVSGSANTAPLVRKMQTALDVAYWGEDNRFPQNIEQQMAYCGVGKAGLDWKARALYGSGIIPGRVKDFTDDGKTEVFQPLTRAEGKEIYNFLERRSSFRFWMEYFQDWTWFGNTFPEIILDNDAKKITGFVHQESCDSRFKQMNDSGIIDTVYLSKMWGTARSQFAKFDKDKTIAGLMENPTRLTEIDNKFLKAIDCIDMYDSKKSLTKIAEKLKSKKGLKSAILPVNYPSVNKTFYQVPSWDGARLGGWVEIASKIPALLKTLFNKAIRIRYHIEVPATYFEDSYGKEVWLAKSIIEKKAAKKKLLKDMEEYLTGTENSFSTFVSYFSVNNISKEEYGRIKITEVPDKSNLDKELITSSAADLQILAAMGVHPTLSGAGSIGSSQQRTGGSDQREAFLIYNAMLKLEREVALEPLYLARDFNQWGDDIVFRIRDTQLTTLDQNKGTTKIVS